MSVKVEISSILNQLKQDISFYQPMLEAIVNSLEARATNIEIHLDTIKQKTLFDSLERVTVSGYTIIDNGVGFNKENRISFSNYLSSYKQKLGCKGIGRFTWLKIFEKISINSYTGTENISFDFDKNFSEDSFNIKEDNTNQKTIIKFDDVLTKYYEKFTTLKSLDNDESLIVDINEIRQLIFDYLSVKLFLLNKKEIKFNIKICIENNTVTISNNDVINLLQKDFSLFATLDEGQTNVKYDFSLYYSFEHNYKSEQKHYYCAHERTVKPFTKSCNIGVLPDCASSFMLLTSNYFDERISDERNQFTFNLADNNKTTDNPIPGPMINEKLKQVINEILLEQYPNLADDNEKIIEECSYQYPHLAKYIKEDKSAIKNKEEVVKTAKKKFEDEKEQVKNNFSKLLKEGNIKEDVFLSHVEKINDISARELAQYFLYREQIIDALNRLDNENSNCEADLHNLFMKMGRISLKEESKDTKYDSNLWLLDDKFMSYFGAFSDKQIKIIKDKILKEYESNEDDKKEPDLTIFYSDVNNKQKDLIVIEFKPISAKSLKKGVALYEIQRNLGIITSSFDDIRNIYGYIITKIDDEFCRALEYQDLTKLFSNGNTPMFYKYNNKLKNKNGNNVDAHIYLLSAEMICSDATARNKLFLDIIRNN